MNSGKSNAEFATGCGRVAVALPANSSGRNENAPVIVVSAEPPVLSGVPVVQNVLGAFWFAYSSANCVGDIMFL